MTFALRCAPRPAFQPPSLNLIICAGNTWLSLPRSAYQRYSCITRDQGFAGLRLELDNSLVLFLPAFLFSASVAEAQATGVIYTLQHFMDGIEASWSTWLSLHLDNWVNGWERP